MTFVAYETSDELSRPVELYTITLGIETFRYTSTEAEFTRGGNTYKPITIERGEISYGPDERSKPLEVTVPASNEIAQKYVFIPPGLDAVFSLHRTQFDDPNEEIVLLFEGKLHAVRFDEDGERASLTIYSIEHDLGAEMPRFGFQSLCNHVLYDDGCGVDENDPTHKFTGVVSPPTVGQPGNVIVVPGADAFCIANDTDFVAGFVKPQGLNDYRLVIARDGDELTLLLPFPVPIVGGTVTINVGCDHLIHGHCAQRFNNVIEFGGFAFVPIRDIFARGLN